MDIKTLEPGFSICHAIYPGDMVELKSKGFRSIICNRVPGEAEDHEDSSALRQAAEAVGLEWVEIPVKPGVYTPEAVEAFGQAIERLAQTHTGFLPQWPTGRVHVDPKPDAAE